ncbi:MAG: aromatic ring-hydroxylating dioxygenase subunit alpha [Armatimonadetes bacterium]|nr:aromatic ring-hydroxylating dioxygenase subunit alpha [Armatimonadota bacterium]
MPRFEMHEDVTRASTIPSAFYTDPQLYEESKERIFAKSWQFVTHLDSVQVPGQTYPFTLLEGCLDEPLLFTRDMDDRVHCMSNVCTHRGNIVCEGAGQASSLRCRYHGRRFNLDGSFKSMPEFDDVQGFPSEKDNLPKVDFAQWRGFFFCNLSPQFPLNEQLKEVDDLCGFMPIEDFVHDASGQRDYVVKCHWALYVDNYLEGFHIPFVHADLSEALDYGDYSTILHKHGNLQLGIGSDECFDLPRGHPYEKESVAAFYFWLYPNLMLNFYPWGLSVNVVRPVGPSQTKVTFIPFVWDESKRTSGAGAALDRVEREDEAIVEMVQKGVRSRYYDRGRYSPPRESGVHQFHQMIAESMR